MLTNNINSKTNTATFQNKNNQRGSRFRGQMRAEQKKIKKNKRWKKIIALIMMVSLLIISGIGFSMYHSLTSAVHTMYQKADPSKKRVDNISLGDKQPFSVLLVGVDKRKGDTGRADSIVVLTVNPINESVKMLSIPRDTRTEIIGHGTTKINHSFAYGGVDLTRQTVENFLDIPIDYFIQVNMESFQDLVNAMGGINVHNYQAFTHGGHYFAEGEIELNGKQALSFSRMRYDDKRGDYGRQTRQREVLKSIINEGASVSSLTKYKSIFEALSKNIRTNLTFDEMVSIQKNYRTASKSIDQIEIKSHTEKIYDPDEGKPLSFEIVTEEEKVNIQMTLKTQLK